jgi:hypothetical protein
MGRIIMTLLIVYVASILVGDLVAVGIAELVEYYSKTASLWVFLALYFAVFWIAWRFAVHVTAPRKVATR